MLVLALLDSRSFGKSKSSRSRLWHLTLYNERAHRGKSRYFSFSFYLIRQRAGRYHSGTVIPCIINFHNTRVYLIQWIHNLFRPSKYCKNKYHYHSSMTSTSSYLISKLLRRASTKRRKANKDNLPISPSLTQVHWWSLQNNLRYSFSYLSTKEGNARMCY